MKATYVALRPTGQAIEANKPSLTPELMAAVGARYSRNNEGLDAILEKIDPTNPDKSVDSIFKMLDYGHQSILDMVPISIFLDGVSIFLAYYIFSLCPMAGGQESSTRYIKMDLDGLLQADDLGIPTNKQERWYQSMESHFQWYNKAVKFWEDYSTTYPGVMRLPDDLLADTSEKAQKQTERMRRNYVFDRARYFIPVACKTNMMLVMSARGWVQLCQELLSHYLPECQKCGELIKQELAYAAPSLLKHAEAKATFQAAIWDEFEKLKTLNSKDYAFDFPPSHKPVLRCGYPGDDLDKDALAHHNNRYAPIGSSFRRRSVTYGWHGVSMGEIRDLNRHRTGEKYCPLFPLGFYTAADQYPDSDPVLRDLSYFGEAACKEARHLLLEGDPTYIYWTALGTEYYFEHTTTANKFIYTAELRTGLGAHFRYAKHFKDLLQLWYQHHPDTRGLILEGSAEPE